MVSSIVLRVVLFAAASVATDGSFAIRHVSNNEHGQLPRQALPSLPNIFPSPTGLPGLGSGTGARSTTSGGGGGGGGGGLDIRSFFGDGDGLGGIISSLGSAVSGLASGLIGDLDGPAMSLGIGIGAGTATGLNVTTADASQEVAAQIAAQYRVAGGVNGLVMSLGEGASSAIVKLVIASPPAADGASVNVTTLQPYAVSLGEAIGNGTRAGLQLGTADPAAPAAAASDLPGLAGAMTLALTRSLLQNVDLSRLNFSLDPKFTRLVAPYVTPAALGMGQGIGTGAQIVLNLVPGDGLAARDRSIMSAVTGTDTAAVAGNFTAGLVTAMFAQVSWSDLIDKVANATQQVQAEEGSSSSTAAKMQLGPIAQGFARGLVQGASDAVEQYGGIQAIVNGTAAETISIPNTTVVFDDGVMGGAVGFGQGLAGQGVVVARQMFGKKPIGWVYGGGGGAKRTVAAAAAMSRLTTRQSSDGSGVGQGLNTSQLLDAAQLSALTQTGLDAITCKGVGGLAAVFAGLLQSGTITLDSVNTVSTSALLQNALPPGTIRLSSDGYTLELDLTAVDRGTLRDLVGGVRVNGVGAIPFVVFLVLHIFIASTVFAFLLPIVSIFASADFLLQWDKKPALPRRLKAFARISERVLYLPGVVLTLLFGLLAMGSSRHFRTAHGILGLLTTLFFLAAAVSAILAGASDATRRRFGLPSSVRQPLILGRFGLDDVAYFSRTLVMLLALPTVVTGFGDLSGTSFCVVMVVDVVLWVVAGLAVTSNLVLAMAAAACDGFVRIAWAAKDESEGDPEGTVKEGEEKTVGGQYDMPWRVRK